MNAIHVRADHVASSYSDSARPRISGGLIYKAHAASPTGAKHTLNDGATHLTPRTRNAALTKGAREQSRGPSAPGGPFNEMVRCRGTGLNGASVRRWPMTQ